MHHYHKEIKSIVEDKEATITRKLEKLEEMYRQKPVHAEWFLAKAKLLLEQDSQGGDSYPTLDGKYFRGDNSEVTAEILQFLAELDLKRKDGPVASYRLFQKNQLLEDDTRLLPTWTQLWEEEEKALQTWEDLLPLANGYLSCGKCLDYYILYEYTLAIGESVIPCRAWIEDSPNFGHIKEAIKNKKIFGIVVDSPDCLNEACVMGRCLAGLGCTVYVLNVPGQVEVDELISLTDTVAVSMDNTEELYGLTLIPAVELIFQGESLGDNSADIVAALCRDENIVVIASGDRFEKLSETYPLNNQIDNLYGYEIPLRTDYFAFGWAGSYLRYIDSLYGMDTKAAVYSRAQCRFSVVIPVRNSAETLQHTLKTCLNQRYQGDFEIIISDNSTEGNSAVYQFCQTITDKRVRYCRTPRDLRLSKSFEYAFLQTRGEYIFSMGADDVMLPWTLEAWDGVIGAFPEEEIFLWDRGFYAWPGFNRGQQHQFIIPGKYEKHNIKLAYIDPMEYLSMAMGKPNLMYILPMLYINSGFKREFMQTLLKETGRLWDGICQDIYMGVIVSALKKKILKISYPFTMAGMSEGSVGAMANRPIESQETVTVSLKRQIQENNVGGFSKSEIECLMLDIGTDVTSLYNSILRAVKRGVIPQRYLEDTIDWKQWFLNTYPVMNKKDIYFDRKMQQMRYAARKHGDDFLKWFDETIYQKAMEPVIFSEEEFSEKTYQEVDNDEYRMLDASKYGVQNSYDASLLFEKLTGL